MFHSARALLYAKNYREKSHYCLNIALKHLYVTPGILPIHFVDVLQKGKALREDADYYDDWSEVGAEESLKLAEDLISKVKNVIHTKN
ncbi:MAG: HEPN domain-containing protein [Candidatus Omnitrophota bacterium]